MAFENYTIKDIAKALKLSTSTVSRALRDSYEISTETKKIVLEYAEKINYRVNPIARSLKERKSNSIGIVVSEITNNFFSQVIDGVESVANTKNYQVVISQTKESQERERNNIEYLYSRSTDGILLALSSETTDLSYIKKLMSRGFPIVFFDRVPLEINAFKVIVDNQQGAFDAVQFLINKGKRRIAHLTASSSLNITQDRLIGYKKALLQNKIVFEEDLVQYCEYSGLLQDEVDKAIELLVHQKFDGIFISGDKLSTGFLQRMKATSTYLEDNNVLVTGFTNSKVVSLLTPTITAVYQPAFEIGKKAAELLIKQIESKYPIEDFETIVLKTQLMDH